jgi:hypothetical protein
MKKIFGLALVLIFIAGPFEAYCYNTAGCMLHVYNFNHPNLIKLTWKGDIIEYDFNSSQFRLRIEFNSVGFQGSQGVCYLGSMIQNLGHSFIPDIAGSQFSSPQTITNFPAVGLYFSSSNASWPDSKHGLKSLTDSNLYPKFARVFENIDNLGSSGKNIYTQQNLIQPTINYPVSIKWIVTKKNTVTNPIENLSKNINDAWVQLSGTFVIWNFQVEINNTSYDVADYYLPIEFAEYLLAGDPLVLHQEYFGAAEMLLNSEKTKVRYSEMSAFDGINWYSLNKWKLTWRIDDGNGNMDNRFGSKKEGCNLISVCGHQDDIVNAIREVNTAFDLDVIATPTINQNGNQLNSSSSSGNQWYLNNILIQGAVGQTYAPTISGNYTVQVAINNCFSPISANYYFIVTALPTINSSINDIKLSANPVADKLVITNTNRKFLNIQLFEISGKKINAINSNSSSIEIEMSPLSPGYYFILIEDKTKKVLGQRKILKL